ncbi:MAG: family 78 glycoside hydrolase catalytic domain [Melioribacteraceae bacterium]|nr:family 78 glycoside hydrolase catalytic domain [Melioribacteraceae bacterium]
MVSFRNLIICLFFLFQTTNAQEQNGRFVWLHENPNVRNEYVYYRYEFNAPNDINEADINLYADSRYQLFVNGVFINFGPARAYPQSAEYDYYDLMPYLRNGKNVIAVKVLYNGIESFQIPDNRPGFIVWGKIKSGSESFCLSTPGEWLCKKSVGYDQNAVRFSFACAAMEVFDGTKENYDWKEIELNTEEWIKPVVIDQNAWGKLKPRSIPCLTKNEKVVKSLIGRYKTNKDEDVYQFRIKTPDEASGDYGKGRRVLAYTYIYSPIDQDVEAGLWWGEFYLNGGEQLKGKGESSDLPMRDPRLLKLKKGWNFFNAHYGGIWGAWDFYMAVPKEAHLRLSPTKDFESDFIFMTAGPFDGDKNEELKEFIKPFKNDKEIKDYKHLDWKPVLSNSKTNNPALDMVWYYPKEEIKADAWKTTDITVENENGNVLVFDLGGKTLGRIFIEFEAPSGTVLDLGISEDLNNGKPWLFKRKMISGAVRFIADGKKNRFETFKPYGLRYIQLNVTGFNAPVKIKKIGVIEQVYPFEKFGSFECSDPMFNSIWELGWRTLRVCAEDSYIDTPFRERGLYAGDMLPEYAITLAVNGDSRLLKRSLMYFHDQYHDELFNGGSNKHEDFLLINVLSSKWYYDYTGDKSIIEFVYDGYKQLMQKWWDTRDENGIMFTGEKFIEWTRIDKDAKLTASHSLYAKTLGVMSEYAKILNKDSDAELFSIRANEVESVVSKFFWDADKNLFNDGYKNGILTGKYYPSSNSWPLLFNCVSDEQKDTVIKYLEKELTDIGEESRNRRLTPYGSFYTLAALYREGKADIAEKFIRQYWSRMIINGDDTAWENFDIKSEHNGGGQGTASHAWSGHPTYFLTTEALGVNLGFQKEFEPEKIFISPHSEFLTWAKGTVPHPAGLIKVEWKIDGENLLVNYRVDNKAEVIVVPRGRLAEKVLWVNGIKQ